MIEPKRAAVRPRVVSLAGGESLLLEEEVQRLLDTGRRGVVAILGPDGSGKTTALRHLADVLPPYAPVAFLDDVPPTQGVTPGLQQPFVVCTADAVAESKLPRLAAYALVEWTRDDLIEYLLVTHKTRCASVMARLRDTDYDLLQGNPELWQVVLEQLAADDTLPDARHALHRHLQAQLSDADLLERVRSLCLTDLVSRPKFYVSGPLEALAKPGFTKDLVRVLRHATIRLLLAAERIAADLHGDADCDFLAKRLPRELVRAAAGLVAADPRALEHLHRLLAGPSWSHAMSASLLRAAGAGWVPPPGNVPLLHGAYLEKARWLGVQLGGADLSEADLSEADLSGADLRNARAGETVFRKAKLRGACLIKVRAAEADFTGADLSAAMAIDVRFDGTRLFGAMLTDATLRHSTFENADLRRANFQGAQLAHTKFTGARIKGTDFCTANLHGADLAGLRLREARFLGADFESAKLCSCDLEGMDLPAAHFRNADLNQALLTNSSMPDADFDGACLRGAGLAGVDWERVSLRGADLTGASFHLGTSRSGLVNSPLASEGSRTGFYTDDYEEQGYKAPEEIRKANLCGADLRGAVLDGVDFYLVDLRGAHYDPEHAELFRRCGAILEARV